MPAPAITCLLAIALYLAIGGETLAAVVIGVAATLFEFFLPSSLDYDEIETD